LLGGVGDEVDDRVDGGRAPALGNLARAERLEVVAVLCQGGGDDGGAPARRELDGERADPPVAPTITTRRPSIGPRASTANSAVIPASGAAAASARLRDAGLGAK
jgi:hypothetical protein